jgi:hypothetical protein
MGNPGLNLLQGKRSFDHCRQCGHVRRGARAHGSRPDSLTQKGFGAAKWVDDPMSVYNVEADSRYVRHDASAAHAHAARRAFVGAIAGGAARADLVEAALAIAAEDDALGARLWTRLSLQLAWAGSAYTCLRARLGAHRSAQGRWPVPSGMLWHYAWLLKADAHLDTAACTHNVWAPPERSSLLRPLLRS